MDIFDELAREAVLGAAYQVNADWVRENVSEIDRIDQLMEECSELLVACSKRKRALQGTNPTPVTAEKAWEEIKEESQDVLNVMHVLGLVDMVPEYTTTRMQMKMARWKARKEAKNGKEDGAQGEEPGEDAVQDADGA